MVAYQTDLCQPTSWTHLPNGLVGAFVRRRSFFSPRLSAEPVGPLSLSFVLDKADRCSTRPTIPVSTLPGASRRPCPPLIRSRTLSIASSRCCGSKVPGGPLESDKFEREAHREIAELKARSRIRQLEAEQRQLQQTQPTCTGDMTTKQLPQL